LVNESDDVPENISFGRLNENGALTYAELFLCRGRAGETCGKLAFSLGLGGDEVDVGVVGIGFENVLLRVFLFFEGGPGLP
jgi:hypothetical protein